MHYNISFALASLGFMLGLRHGIDWDHIAAITDISGSTVTADTAANAATPVDEKCGAGHAFWLVTLYALGHATMVVGLGMLAIWASAILPKWIDPVMERIVGVTLVLLGVYVFYSLWKFGTSFRMHSRWMLVLSLIGRAWASLRARLTGKAAHSHDVSRYGPRTAFVIGVVHGLGAETGSQAVLLASAARVTSPSTGSLLLLFFTIGLLVSNSLVACFALGGFLSSRTRQRTYASLSVCVGFFSLFVGCFFVCGRATALPDLQAALSHVRWL